MRNIQLGKFDVLITMFNAIGHLTKHNFVEAIHNIYNNLKADGIYVFDIFNLNAMSEAVVSELSMLVEKQLSNTKVHLSQFSTLDRDSGLLTSYNNYSTQIANNAPKDFQSRFVLQIYSKDDLVDMLYANGFKVIEQYGIYGEEFIGNQTLNILMVAQKK
jgi:hypothetical protein